MADGQTPKPIPTASPKQPPKVTSYGTGGKSTSYPVGWTNWGMHGPRATGPLPADPGLGK